MKISNDELNELELLINRIYAEKLKKNFWYYCKYMDEIFFSSAKEIYLKQVADALQRVYEGKIKKLAISMPPRSGKSYITSLWVTWVIGNDYYNPDLSIMRNAYGNKLANKFSYDIREIIRSPKYLDVFPYVRLKEDKQTIDDWSVDTASQSTYFCAGVGGAITGKGCKTAGILDDAIKNIEEALSPTILEKTWQWVTSTHYTRFEKDCPIIHIGTRWNKKDPIGKAIEEDNGEGWTQIIVPALTQEGKSFCEEVKTTEEYYYLKKITPDFIWESEFMQNPIDTTSLLYPEQDLKRFAINEFNNGLNAFESIIGYTDTADEGRDYLASGILGIIGNKYYLIDVIYTQDPIEVTQPLVAQQIISNEVQYHIVESNAGGKSFALKLRELVNTKSKCYIKWKPTTKNKETRIIMMSGFIKENFYFRNDYQPGSDYDKFMREVTSYSRLATNDFDDATDCITGLAEMLFKNKIEIL